MTADVADRPQTVAEAAETARDLQAQARELMGNNFRQGQETWEIIDASPKRELWVLYSMVDGTKVTVPEFVGRAAINKRVVLKGRSVPAWTADSSKAPQYRAGKVKCFKHPEAPEAGVIAELGIMSDCTADELRSPQAKRVHGMRLHKNDWEAYQEHLGLTRDEEYRDQQRKQTAATLELAKAAAGSAKRGT